MDVHAEACGSLGASVFGSDSEPQLVAAAGLDGEGALPAAAILVALRFKGDDDSRGEVGYAAAECHDRFDFEISCVESGVMERDFC